MALIPAAEARAQACNWTDTQQDDAPIILVQGGTCGFSDLAQSRHISMANGTALVTASIVIEPDAVLNIISSDILRIRLNSTAEGFANIEANGSTLRIDGVQIESYDPTTGLPDTDLSDGRAYIRVDAYVDDAGQARNARFEMSNSAVRYLGYETRQDPTQYSGYGLTLKVRDEQNLPHVAITGWIRNSRIEHNYRGYYSYGARDITFIDNIVAFNHDYGVDPHDDSSGFIGRRNTVAFNSGTGIAISRRCGDSVIADNHVIGNGANGILIHDLSNNTLVHDNVVASNWLDGIVIHDSHAISVQGNVIRNNRNGLRLFAGSTLIAVQENNFRDNRNASLILLAGWLDQADDLDDYSDGTSWNGQNISRHSDGRVRGVIIENNIFASRATLIFDNAAFVNARGNRFLANVTFTAQDTTDLSLDGTGAVGTVSYRLRRSRHEPASYSIAPPPGSLLSVMSGDIVDLTGDINFLPADNTNFSLLLRGGEYGQIVTATGQDPLEIQTGVLKPIPLAAIAGAVSISSYIGEFERYEPARIEMSSRDWPTTALSTAPSGCNLIEWTIGSRFTQNRDDFMFFGLQSEVIEIATGPIAEAGRIIADIRCIPNTEG
jgi:parallel beta-helix repeat protein